MKNFGKYSVLSEISRGAMGVIYKAQDEMLERVVAIKTLNETYTNDKSMLVRFKNEARAAAILNHPNIITIYELGEEEGLFYIVMELLEGEDLRELMERKEPISLTKKLSIVKSVAEGLAYAHQRNVIHRDIKPANIMLLKNGGVKITDFGIAHLESSHITRTGMVVGTPDYMSPEQVLSKQIDNRTDIFSLGIILYQLITNRKPFQASSVSSVMYKISNNEPPSFDSLDIDLPFEIESIVFRSLEKDPSKRYQNMEEMLSDLSTALQLMAKHEREDSMGSMAQAKFIVTEAERLLAEERPEEARAALKRANKLEPNNVVISKLTKKAETAILKEKNYRIRNIILRAESAASNKEYEAAIRIAQSTFSIIPNNPMASELIEKLKQKIKLKTGAETVDIEKRFPMARETSTTTTSSELIPIDLDSASTGEHVDFLSTDARNAIEVLPKNIRTFIQDADRIYYGRKSIVEVVFSINQLMKAVALDENNYEAAWRIGRNYYQKGMLITSISEQKRAFNQGIAWARKATDLINSRAEGFYWLAVNLAKWADVNGIFRGIVLVKKIMEALDKVINLDDKYSGGGGYRVLGRMKFRMPSIIGGSVKEAIGLLEKSLQIEPRHPDSLLFLAEALIHVKKHDEARKHLNTLMEMEPLKTWQFETHQNRKIAEEMLAEMAGKG